MLHILFHIRVLVFGKLIAYTDSIDPSLYLQLCPTLPHFTDDDRNFT
jgi:hypothetical protein